MAHASLVDDIIVVDTAWNEKELIKRISGARWDAMEKRWTLPLTWVSCLQLRGVFGDRLTIGDKLNEWAWVEKKREDFLMRLRSAVSFDELRDIISVTHNDWLYPFQEVGAEFLNVTGETLLGDEMGTGKTVQTLAALTDEDYPVLVVCPNSVKQSWRKHVHEWTPDEVTPYVIEGGAAQRAKILKVAADDPYAVIIVNYEALRGLTRLAPFGSTRLRKCRVCDPKHGEEGITATKCQTHPKELNRIPFKTVVIDEAHKVKSPSSQQTRAVWAVAHGDLVRNRWALTGTPLANHPGDLWSVLHAISPKDFPTKSHFVDRYCLQSWNAFGGLDIVGINPATRDEFFRLLDPRFRRMQKDVVLSQLPPKVRSVRWVEMAPKQRKAYDELDTNLATMTSGGVLVAPNALVAKVRQMQLSSSTVDIIREDDTSLDGWVVRMVEPSPKLDALEDVLEELEGKQVAICANHKQLINLAAARLTKAGKTLGLITGDITPYDRDLALRKFQAGELQYLLFTIAAGGVGLTMTAADTLVFLQRSWSMIDNKQAEDRVHRIGAEVHESVHIIDIVTRDSIEERQIEVLFEKFARLQEIVRDTRPEARDEADQILASEILI